MTTTTSTEVAVRTGGALAVGAEQTAWTPQQLAVLRSAGVNEQVSEPELSAFLHECQRTGLDPFTRQIYLIGRYDKRVGRDVYRSQTGIDGYRVVAHRAARREGVGLSYADTVWCGPDGVWREVWLWDKPPLAAKITVFRDGLPFPAIATLAEYAARWPNGELKDMWKRMPANQLAKCAEALALRKAFPHDLAGVYTAEEMEQADSHPAPRELTAEQAAQQMRRSKGQQADDWATDPDDPQQPAEERASSQAQRKALVVLIERKRGVSGSDRGSQRTIAAGMLGHPVKSFTDLSAADASALIDKLTAMPDHIADAEVVEEPGQSAPNPRNGDGGKPLDPALFVPDLQALVISSQTEGGLGVYDHLRKLIGEATTTSVLKALWRVANEARKTDEVSTQDFDKLNALSQERNAQLSGQAPAGQPSDAPNSEQYDARDHFRHEIKRAGTPEDLGAIWNKVLEARDAGQLTQIQVDGLNREIEARYQAMPGAKPPEQSGEGWSHAHPVAQRLDEAVSAGGGR